MNFKGNYWLSNIRDRTALRVKTQGMARKSLVNYFIFLLDRF
jgi:hypothetical protein